MKRLAGIVASVVATMTAVGFAAAQAPPGGNAGAAANPALSPYLRRSIVQHYPSPYPEYYHNDDRAGFRNPGGVGRYLEYYPPGNRFQSEEGRDPVRVAQFGGGGIPDRAEQLAAQQVGIARENAIMGHIDNYARPAFGVGFFGGFY